MLVLSRKANQAVLIGDALRVTIDSVQQESASVTISGLPSGERTLPEMEPGQIISLGDNITMKLIRIRDNTAVLGFTAPREVRIWREEIAPRALFVKPKR